MSNYNDNYPINILNDIGAKLGAEKEATYPIDALNEIAKTLGGTGRAKYPAGALSEIAELTSGEQERDYASEQVGIVVVEKSESDDKAVFSDFKGMWMEGHDGLFVDQPFYDEREIQYIKNVVVISDQANGTGYFVFDNVQKEDGSCDAWQLVYDSNDCIFTDLHNCTVLAELVANNSITLPANTVVNTSNVALKFTVTYDDGTSKLYSPKIKSNFVVPVKSYAASTSPFTIKDSNIGNIFAWFKGYQESVVCILRSNSAESVTIANNTVLATVRFDGINIHLV